MNADTSALGQSLEEPVAAPHRPLAVLVVGMHRSGTSALGGVINLFGAATPGENLPANEGNKKGYFENKRVVAFNDALLAALGSRWDDPLPLAQGWEQSAVAQAAIDDLVVLIREEFGAEAIFLLKDPRLCRLLPLWLAALSRCGMDQVAMLPFRHPFDVAGSLASRNDFSRSVSIALWLDHVIEGERWTRGLKRTFLSYESLLSDWRKEMATASDRLDVVWPRQLMRIESEVDRFLSSDLQTHRTGNDSVPPHDGLHRLAGRALKALHSFVRDPYSSEASAEFDRIRAELAGVVDMLGPLVVWQYEQTEGLRKDLQAEIRAAHAEVLARDNFLAEKDERIALEARRIADLSQEVLGRDKRIEDLSEAIIQKDVQIIKRDEIIAQKDKEISQRDAIIRRRDVAVSYQAAQVAAGQRLVGELNSRVEALTAERNHYAAENARNLGDLQAALHRLAKVENSPYWRVSGPLRRLFSRKERRRSAFLASGGGQIDETRFEVLQSMEAKALLNGSRQPSVVFISGEANTPGHLYRVTRYVTSARTAGADAIEITLDEVSGMLERIEAADLIVIWRAAWDHRVAAAVEAARRGKAVLVFDVDDLMFEPELAKVDIIDGIRSQGLEEDPVRDHYNRVLTTFAHCDYGSAPTEFLAHRMRLRGKPSFVLPNGFDEDVFEHSQIVARRHSLEARDGLVRIGYATGSRTHQKDFGIAAAAIARTLRIYPQCRLVLFAHRGVPVMDVQEFPVFEGLEAQIEWRELVPIQDLPGELARFDINIAPLEVGNLFCEAKSELKFYEAALVNVPTIASPTEPFRTAIRDGVSGLLANNEDEWFAALSRLVEDDGLRASMARNALFDAIAWHGPERRADLFAGLMDETLRSARYAARSFATHIRESSLRPLALPNIPPHKILFESDELGQADATVVIPLYNYEQYVVEALESVAAQTVPVLDLIVVDDSSTDQSLSVAMHWIERNAKRFNRVMVVHNTPNAGLSASRNVGFCLAQSRFVLPLDADNTLSPKCIETCLAVIEQSGAAYAYPIQQQFGDANDTLSATPYDPRRLINGNYIDALALVRKAAWAMVGGYESVKHGWEDYDFWCKLAEFGLFGQLVPEILARYRVHGASMLRTVTDLNRNKLRLIADVERRHNWLRIERPSTPAVEASAPSEEKSELSGAPALLSDRAAIDRLERLLSILRCPVTKETLDLLNDSVLVSRDTGRRWPIVDGRPVLFANLENPRIMPRDHFSNEVPDRAQDLIRSVRGPVLNLSAGGTHDKPKNVIEVEFALFRNTDLIADAHVLPFEDNVFDAVIAMNAFEHYRSPPQAASEIMRVLKPGGRVLIRTAFLQPLHEPPYHFYNCTQFGLQEWFNGFETIDLTVSENFNPAYAVSWLMSDAQQALEKHVSPHAAAVFTDTQVKDLVAMWRDPGTRNHAVWQNFLKLPIDAQEALAAGFEYLGSKPL